MSSWPLLSADLGRGVRERPVRFRSPATPELAGVLSEPASPRRTGVVFAHGWSGVRSGPHDILTRMARDLSERGFPCMRFDLGGRGESRGNGLEARLATMAADLESAVEALRRNASVDGVILFGMCSGGNVAIGALPRIQGVQGLVMLSVYPFSDGDAFGRDVNRTLHFAAVYWRKLYRGETWKRFLRGDVDLGAVFNVLFGHFRKRRSKSAEPTPSTAPGATSQAVGDPSREGRKQVDPPKKHLQNLRSDLPGLLVYGTADPDASASMAYYGGYARENGIPLRIVQVEGATHNFASAIWTADVRTHVLRFCLELVGGAEHDHD